MDISDSLAPSSDQLDAIELIAGPRTFTIASVSAGSVEQPINVHLKEFPRVWRPSKGMRRVLAAGWGAEASEWRDRRVTLYYDETVTFGKERPGGTRISHMSNLRGGKALKIAIPVSRGKTVLVTVEPLPDAPAAPTAEQIATCTDPETLRGWWTHTALRPAIKARIDELTNEEAQLFADGNQ